METFFQGIGLSLVGVVLLLLVGRQSRDLAFVLSMGLCVLVCLGALEYLEQVIALLERIRRLGQLDEDFLGTLLKCAGVSLLGEVAGLICMDAGEQALGRAIGLLANGAVVYFSIPLVEGVLELLEEVLGQV